MGEYLSSARRFAGLTIRPFNHAVANALGFLAFIGLPIGVSRIREVSTAGLVALGVLAILLALAGVRLQRELDRRDEVRFQIDPSLDVGTAGEVVRLSSDPHAWKVNAVLFATVTNQGPTARFAARVDDVHPVTRLMGASLSSYSVDEVAWEHTIEGFNELPKGSSARRKVATAAEWHLASATGPGWWFRTAKSASYSPEGHGVGWHLEAPERGAVSVTLTVVSVDANEERTEELQVDFYSGIPRTVAKR